MIKPFSLLKITFWSSFISIFAASLAFAKSDDKQPAFKINGKTVGMNEVIESDRGTFFELEQRRYDIVERYAMEKYLEQYWQKKAKDSKTSIEAAKKAHFDKNVKFDDAEVKMYLEKVKEHPQMKKLSAAEQKDQVMRFLRDKEERRLQEEIVTIGMQKKELVMLLSRPKEPTFEVKISKDDHVRFGPEVDDKPTACKGDDCPVTIVEYSEFQCPFCQKVQPTARQILTEYRGKVRWITRDFPLSFHDRARPAAVAAHCAGDQGKYWKMYQILFENQQQLSDDDFQKYAEKIGLDKGKFQACVKNPQAKDAIINASLESGSKLGVSGTPAYFINGRRLSGAVPPSDFKRIIEEELAKPKKS